MNSINTTKLKLPKSIRKFIRLEKTRIREQFFDVQKQKEMIQELYKKFIVSIVSKDDIKASISNQKVKVPLNSNLQTLNFEQITKSKSKIQKAQSEKTKVHLVK